MAWYTTQDGRHVNTDWFDKESQIARNKEQADKLNSTPPRRLYMENIVVSKDTVASDVLDLYTHERFKFKEGSEIREVHAFAGKGCLKTFEKAEKYAQRYGGNASDWQHCSGIASITNGETSLVEEVHWVQGSDGKIREAFIKY